MEENKMNGVTATNPDDGKINKLEILKIKKDRMRFTKNKLPSSLTLLAILINVFYFVSIYKSNALFYYKPMIGVSVLCNLFFMLAGFLASEGIKNYKASYGIILIVLACFQVLRIFYYPIQAHSTYINEESGTLVMETAQFIRVIIYLASSAGLLLAAGIIGIEKSVRLQNYREEIGEEKPA